MADAGRLYRGTTSPLGLLLSGTFLNAMGYQLFIPALPLFLHVRGATSTLVGFTAAGGLLGRLRDAIRSMFP